MKRMIVLLLAIAFVSPALAVTGYDGPKDQPHIMGSGSSASASAGVNENGTTFRTEVTTINKTCSTGNTTAVDDIKFYSDEASGRWTVNFTGSMETATPCQVLEHEVKKINDSVYELRFTSKDSGQMCVQCVGSLKYRAEFSLDRPFELRIVHNGEQVKTLTTPEPAEDDTTVPDPEKGGFLTRVFTWLGSLF